MNKPYKKEFVKDNLISIITHAIISLKGFVVMPLIIKYVGINIPVSLAKVLDEIVKKEGIYGTRAALVKHLIQDWVESYRKEQKLGKN